MVHCLCHPYTPRLYYQKKQWSILLSCQMWSTIVKNHNGTLKSGTRLPSGGINSEVTCHFEVFSTISQANIRTENTTSTKWTIKRSPNATSLTLPMVTVSETYTTKTCCTVLNIYFRSHQVLLCWSLTEILDRWLFVRTKDEHDTGRTFHISEQQTQWFWTQPTETENQKVHYAIILADFK